MTFTQKNCQMRKQLSSEFPPGPRPLLARAVRIPALGRTHSSSLFLDAGLQRSIYLPSSESGSGKSFTNIVLSSNTSMVTSLRPENRYP